jgi:capsid assembly protease
MNPTPRIEAMLFNKPLLATPDQLETVLDYLGTRNASSDLSTFNIEHIQRKPPEYDSASRCGFLNLNGPLAYRATVMNALCGLQSFQQIEADTKTLIEFGAKTIVLDVDSGGGEAYSCFETASLLRQLADENNIKLIAYVDGLAASAAYALSATAHQIILNPYAEAGSIGVVVKLRNTSEAMQRAGIKDTFVFAGDSKIPFATSGDWSKEFLEDIQMKVDVLYKEFVGHVAKYRPIAPQAIIDTKAKVLSAQQAQKIGLADALLSREEFSIYLKTGQKPTSKPTSFTPHSFTKKIESAGDGVTLSIQRLAQKRLNTPPQSRLERITSVARTLGEADYILKNTRHMNNDEFELRIKALTR